MSRSKGTETMLNVCYILTSLITIIRMSKSGARVNIALLLDMLENINTAHT